MNEIHEHYERRKAMREISSLTLANEIRFLAEAVLDHIQRTGSLDDSGQQAKVDLLAIISITEFEL